MKPHLLIAALLLIPFSSAAASDEITKELITSKRKTWAYYLNSEGTFKPEGC